MRAAAEGLLVSFFFALWRSARRTTDSLASLVRFTRSEPRDESDPVGPGYDWAIVSGGKPTIPTGDDGKCRTGSGQNDSGFWLFTREKIASEATLEEMRAVASEKGFDLSALEPVTHEGCEYSEE